MTGLRLQSEHYYRQRTGVTRCDGADEVAKVPEPWPKFVLGNDNSSNALPRQEVELRSNRC